jgi:hypothetical protein
MTPINSLLYADDVALIGSSHEVRQMLELAGAHSLALGYRWSPSKCAILNPPSRTSSRWVPHSIYNEAIPIVEEFVYLGVPFRRNGISVPSMLDRRKRATMYQMSQLNQIGVNRSGFPLLFSSRLYAAFARPMIEYGLAIAHLRGVDYTALEKIQDKSLRMIFGGHSAASTAVFNLMTNLPSMRFRADVLATKYCLRAQTLPQGCLFSLLSASVASSSLDVLRGRKMYQDLSVALPAGSSTRQVSTWLHRYRQDLFTEFHATTDKVLIKACLPFLRIDPVMYVPASRADRSRLIRWRMHWLPGTPRECACHIGRTTRRHLGLCPRIPYELYLALPPPMDPEANPIDNALNLLPVSRSAAPPPYWVELCTILWHIDQLCNPDGDYTTDSPPGQEWVSQSHSLFTDSLVQDER